jgi:hypothetical protein
MKGSLKQVVLAGCLIVAAGVACRKPVPILPKKPVPAGTVLFQFTKKVEGPVELTVDGIRIPVGKVGKKCQHLAVTGLAAGKHQLILLSPLDAFGPDQIEVELTPTSGVFKLLFAQQFKSVLYGKPEPTPPADGIPGVKASLQP